jgi:hypothetical protein
MHTMVLFDRSSRPPLRPKYNFDGCNRHQSVTLLCAVGNVRNLGNVGGVGGVG